MVFSSLEFLGWFLPFFLLIYYLLPPRLRNACILFFSLVFYGYGSLDHPSYLLLIVASVVVNYLLGLGIRRCSRKKCLLVLGLIYNFGILLVFKYLDFLLGIVGISGPGLALPIGISFFTFQVVSYLVDVYRSTVPPEGSLLKFGTYILMFPQLIAGPIVRYSQVRERLRHRTYHLRPFLAGLRQFTLGLGFKVLLANQLGGLWNEVNTIGFASVSTPLAWMGIWAYSLQLYFDFYGYSLMAMGLGRMMGFSLPQNFDQPYFTCTMTEFWRKWHITLGSWFREYVYIPLGGNRAHHWRNMLVVWLFTGLWHGAGWNFLLWGFVLFLILAFEKSGPGRFLERHRLVGHAYMALLIPLTWLIFAVEELPAMAVYLGRLVGLGGVNVFAGDAAKYWGQFGWLLVTGILLCTPLPRAVYRRFKNSGILWLALAAIFAASVYCIYMGLNDPFLYFRF